MRTRLVLVSLVIVVIVIAVIPAVLVDPQRHATEGAGDVHGLGVESRDGEDVGLHDELLALPRVVAFARLGDVDDDRARRR